MSKNKYKNQKNSGSTGKSSPEKRTQEAQPAFAAKAIAAPVQPTAPQRTSPNGATQRLQPEQMSLNAYRHIQECLDDKKVESLKKEDVTAVIQLAQHLRVFGLLSAVGYVRHAREGKIRERVRPMWTPLLWRLVCGNEPRPEDEKQARQKLMNATYRLSTEDQKGYMVKWRQGLQLSNHWNFWARAYQEEEADEQRTEDGNLAGETAGTTT